MPAPARHPTSRTPRSTSGGERRKSSCGERAQVDVQGRRVCPGGGLELLQQAGSPELDRGGDQVVVAVDRELGLVEDGHEEAARLCRRERAGRALEVADQGQELFGAVVALGLGGAMKSSSTRSSAST